MDDVIEGLKEAVDWNMEAYGQMGKSTRRIHYLNIADLLTKEIARLTAWHDEEPACIEKEPMIFFGG